MPLGFFIFHFFSEEPLVFTQPTSMDLASETHYKVGHRIFQCVDSNTIYQLEKNYRDNSLEFAKDNSIMIMM